MNIHEKAQQLRNTMIWDQPAPLIHVPTTYPTLRIKVQRLIYATLRGDGK